jgi:outer membrane protein assembly factor BamB
MYWGINLMRSMVKRHLLILPFVSVFILMSCASESLHVPKPIAEIRSPERLLIQWNIDALSSSDAGSFVPVVDGEAIFTADSSGEILKVDITDGTIINQIRLKYKLSSGTAVSNDSIFVTTVSGDLLSVNKATGEVRWTVHLPTISIEAPQVMSNVVVVKTNDAEVLAYNSNTGSLLWVYQTTTPPLTLRAYNTFQTVLPDVLIVGQPGGKLSLLNLTNGNPIWEDLVAIPEGSTDLDKLTDIVARPVLKNKQICVASFNGKIECIDAVSNNIMWDKKFSSNKGLLLDEQNVYAVNTDSVVYAFDKSTGSVVWENADFQYHVLGDPVFLGNNLLIVETDGHINLLNSASGKLVARIKSNLKNGVALPWSDKDKVIVQSGNGHIAKITQ